MNTHTTLRELREAEACQARYRHLCKALGGVKAYGLDTPLSVLKILECNGISDARWAIANASSLDELFRLFTRKSRGAWESYLTGPFSSASRQRYVDKCEAIIRRLCGEEKP